MRYTQKSCHLAWITFKQYKVDIMKITKVLMVVTVAAVLMAGCAQQIWVNPSVSNEQANREFNECKYDAVKHTPGYDFVGDPVAAAFAAGMRENEIMSACMASKGYSLQSKE